ncbi:hypothetical protein NBRC116584_35390 [Hydrogenophaga sp. 5NK40-0174]
MPGKTINENTVFITGLAGSVAGGVGGALAGDTTRDLQANMNMGQITGSNAVANNYLKHDEAKKLQALKDKELFGKCDGNCKAEITRLKEVDEARNQELAACEGSSSAKCQETFNEVRFAAAEYIRKESFVSGATLSFHSEKSETLDLAGSTVDGKLKGAAQGGWEAVKESAKRGSECGQDAVRGGHWRQASLGGHQTRRWRGMGLRCGALQLALPDWCHDARRPREARAGV